MSKRRRVNDDPVEHLTPDEMRLRLLSERIILPREDRRDWMDRHPVLAGLLMGAVGLAVVVGVFLLGGYND